MKEHCLREEKKVPILADLKMYGRFMWQLRSFFKHTLTLAEAKRVVKRRMEGREDNFLRLVRKGIYGYFKSPYLPLLKLAGCEYGDLERLVKEKGLEQTLYTLREAGVYVTFEEFKGREPILRNNKTIPVKPHQFDNPYLRRCYEGETGGTTGAGTRVGMDLDHLAAQASFLMLALEPFGVLSSPSAIWYGVPPDLTGFNSIFRFARLGKPPEKWFLPITQKEIHQSFKNRMATQCLIHMGRLFGYPIPRLEPVPLNQAMFIARWADENIKTHGSCFITTHVSQALRICLAAQEGKINLKGATIMGSGEQPTETKVKKILQTGVHFIPSYNFVETGFVAVGCTQPLDINDLHLFKDSLALITYPRQIPGGDVTVPAFHFTSLLPTAPKLMLNVESDDYGLIESRRCGCPMEAYGYTEHLRQIHSFRKLTGEGVTLVGSEMIYILEEVLPKRFGGTPLDYQLIEEEDEKGFTHLSLIVHPRIEIKDEGEVIKTILEGLGHSSDAANLARIIWDQAKTLRVKREEPISTARGKLMPLHLSRTFKS